MKKLVLASLVVWGMTAVLNAAPIVRIDFPCQNFWGQIKCLDKLPDGVWIGERTGFYDKKKKGYDFPMVRCIHFLTERCSEPGSVCSIRSWMARTDRTCSARTPPKTARPSASISFGAKRMRFTGQPFRRQPK